LTKEQQVILDNLSDSDVDDTFPENWDKDFQRSILSMLLQDKYFLLQGRNLIRSCYFTDKAQKLICDLLFKFYDEYNDLPTKKCLSHEISVTVEDEAKRLYFLGELSALYQSYHSGLDSREYLQDNIVNFAQTQKIKVAFKDSMKVMKDYGIRDQNTWDKVKVILREALLLEKNFDIGLDYFNQLESRYDEIEESQESGEKFITNFPSIDEELQG